ncbi:MAG: hypothetical protein GY808_08800 [Gammaproteobacteria bacterium]|nr:hypothetical protein [Gammaproteobacteria bacterium]
MKIWITLSLLLFISGCISTFNRPDTKLDSVNSYINKSKALIKLQRWNEAYQLLQQGTIQFPKNQTIKAALEKTSMDWENRNNRLESWMLVYEMEGLLLKRPLLISMAESDPDNYRYISRLSYLKNTLLKNRSLLISCAEHQIKRNLRLAKRCIEAARIIKASNDVSKLAYKIAQKQSGVTKRKEQKAKKSDADAHIDGIKGAKIQLEAQAYYEAINLLQPLLLSNSEDIEANLLMDEAKAGRSLQVLRLTRQGDQFYRDEKIEEALKSWETAASLYPESSELQSRIERAKKVLEQLQEIRSRN